MSFPHTRAERRWGIGFVFALFFEALFVFLGMLAFTASIMNALIGAWLMMLLTLLVAGVFTWARDMLRDWRRGQ